jgi:hypothetical protein
MDVAEAPDATLNPRLTFHELISRLPELDFYDSFALSGTLLDRDGNLTTIASELTIKFKFPHDWVPPSRL